MIDFNHTRPFGISGTRIDLDAVVAGLRASAESWVPRLFPNGRRLSNEWRLANIRGDAPRKNGSCVIQLEGDHAGDWHDFDGGDGGGPISAIEHGTGLVGRALYEYAAELAGPPQFRPTRKSASSSTGPSKVARDIDFILSRAAPIAGTDAETYLATRRLQAPSCPDLLFNPDVTYWDTKTGYPAMIAVVRDIAGNRTGIHRTYLAPDGSAKADVQTPRMMLGEVGGGALRLATPAGGLLGIAEGIETALSVAQSCPHLPVWAALSTSGIDKVALPGDVRRVVILADHDVSGGGLRAAETAAQRFHAEARQVWIALPPVEGEDFNNVLMREGPDAVRAIVDAARAWTPPVPSAAPRPRASAARDAWNRPVGFPEQRGPRPLLRADNGDLADLTARSRAVLELANEPPWLFRMGGRHGWVERDDDGRAVACALSEDRLRNALAELIEWLKANRNNDLVPAYPPTGLIKNLLATPNPNLPVLAGIVAAPVFAKTGEMVTARGYHPATRLMHEPPEGFEIPPVPERPTPGEIAAARSLLLDDLLGEFPFVSEAERAHALALLLLPFVRPMIEGPTPLHLIEKPAPGTGATLMVDAIAIVTTGHGAAIMTEGRDEEEWRKRITAKLREAPLMLVIDNLRRPLDASAVAAALTAPSWEDRILGRSEMARMPVRCAWVATGNNPRLSNEIARRSVRIRLDAHVDQPWRREGFRHPNLLAWVHANRPRLVAACLTLGRAWVAAGRLRFNGTTLGSFESWAETLGGILATAGVPGFLANADELYEASDSEGATWRAFVALWWARHGTAQVGTAELFALAGECEPPLPLGDGGERSQRTRLGRALGQMRDRVFDVGGLLIRIRTAGVAHQAQRWQLAVEKERGERGERGERHPGSSGNDAVDARGERGERGERHPAPFQNDAAPPGERGERHPRQDYDQGGERGNVVDQRSPPRSPVFIESNQCAGERGERGERVSNAHARADARARACARMETPGKGSPTFPRSPNHGDQSAFGGERVGERVDDVPRAENDRPEPLSFDAIFEAHGLNALIDEDRIEATRLWLAQSRAPPT